MILLGANAEGKKVYLDPKMANRHGLIAGATGTGKTVTLQVLIESFSRLGVPVFTADIKGDLSGLCAKAKAHKKIDERIQKIGIDDYEAQPCPVRFWDVFGKAGNPVRTTISEMGPNLLANLLELNDTQEGVLNIAFDIADSQGLLLLDIKDLRSMLNWLSDNRKEIERDYGAVASQSVAAIIRKLLVLEKAGGKHFFGEPALAIEDLLLQDPDGQGVVNVLDGKKLMMSPRIYATFLLWLLSELFEELEEVGDADLPRLVFFFDEAHLLFDNAPKALLERVEQVVRLIRSKGVGVFFITQNPSDVPEGVLGQLGNRVQHALRAFTPKDMKAVKSAAQSFRANTKLDTATVITELGLGEALVSTLDEKGRPSVVERTLICPPESLIGPIAQKTKKLLYAQDDLAAKYHESVDRESAYELLAQREEEKTRVDKASEQQAVHRKKAEKARAPKKASSRRQSVGEAFFKSVSRAVGSSVGRRLVRGVLGSLLGR